MTQALLFQPQHTTPVTSSLSLIVSLHYCSFEIRLIHSISTLQKQSNCGWNWMMKSPWNLPKHHHLLIKSLVAFLLLGLAFRLLFVRDSDVSSEIEPDFSQDTLLAMDSEARENEERIANTGPLSSVESEGDDDEEEISPRTEKCDIFTGDWVPNEAGPTYTNQSCPYIESHQNCMRNGRPDTAYLNWRWKPIDCDLPEFNPKRFLKTMRNKVWALVGDSISRNHVQSLLCMLATVERPVEVYHDKEYKSRRWHFPSHNLTISVLFSPFLVKATIFEDFNGVSTSEVQVDLDKLDKKWMNLFPGLDYMIISTGKWFLKDSVYHENNQVVGCHNCPKRGFEELGFDYAYRKALRLVMNFIANSGHKGTVFFRTSTPDHFENGEWSSGGTCKRMSPAKNGTIHLKDLHVILRDIELEEFKNVTEKASSNGVKLKLLDVVPLSLLRPDGHPGPYREYDPFKKGKNAKVQNDCLHWCLPGPIDSWNELIMDMVVNG